MDFRQQLPSSRGESPRPGSQRKRSNSLPLVEALGCSTPEAELILREGRAAVRSRQARRRARQARESGIYRPRDHLKYLDWESAVSDSRQDSPVTDQSRSRRHSRIPSDATVCSTSTITALTQPAVDPSQPAASPSARPLGDYSANLASFIRSQLNSIPSYNPTQSSLSPSSCPDLSFPLRTPPHSPTTWTNRPLDAPQSIEIPPIRPPLRSTFSAWSSTDEDTDDDVPPLPSTDALRKVDTYTPSVLGYYENSSSFLFTSTPLEEEEGPETAKGVSFPNSSDLPLPSAGEQSSPSFSGDYPSSALSTHLQLTSSSAPSISSASTASYFECKRPISFAPGLRDRIIAAVTPPLAHHKMVSASSPFEGQALANLHDITVDDNLRRVLVDGMSFDMVRDLTIPDEGLRRVPTPC